MSDQPAPVMPGNAGRADYPKMLYHQDGRTIVVDSPDEHQRLHEVGWQQTPLPVHQRPAVAATPVMGGSDPMGQLLRATVETILDERGLTRANIAALLTLVAAPAASGPSPPFLPDRQRDAQGHFVRQSREKE